MIIPALMTVGILGLLYASRGTPASTTLPGQLPAPPVPNVPAGMIAQVGDTVEVTPGAITNLAMLRQQFLSLPQDATITGVFVTVNAATTLDLEGIANGLSYTTPAGSGSVGLPFGGYNTPRFPRALVAHVYRDGDRIA